MNANDKKNFGQLQVFKNLIVFAHDNGRGQSGGFVDANMNEIKPIITAILKQNRELREAMRQCVNDATGIIVM